MRTIAIINQKGGCGKTTTSINLAACLARLGQKTLLVDMDPQGHCGVGLAVPEDQIERTILDALIEPSDGKVAKMPDLIWQIASDFDLAPSNLRLAAFEQIFAGRAGREDRLRAALETVSTTYNWTIIDCPPSVGLITFNALRACDEVIVPVETGFFSLHGLTKMMETLEHLREQCKQQIKIHVLPTLYDTRTKLAREVLSELRGKFKDYLMESTVNFNTKLKEAASFGQPITEYDPGSRGYKDFVNLARELMGQRPVEVEPVQMEKLSRPAELAQRAKQLAQLTNVQFGRNTVAMQLSSTNSSMNSPMSSSTASAHSSAAIAEAPVATNRRNEFEDTERDARVPQLPARKTTAQKIEEFYGVKQMGSEILFSVKFPEAASVVVAGDFNSWSTSTTPLAEGNRPGDWSGRMILPAGRYRYRLVVDGQWMTDPHNTYVETNQFGEMNNVIEVD